MIANNEIIAIETPVTDILYDEKRAHAGWRNDFLHCIQPNRPPRKGENILVPIEAWREHLITFADKRGLPYDATRNVAQQAQQIHEMIFGIPRALQAGGALANTFDAMVKAQIDGAPLTDGRFITAIGVGLYGQVFADSLPGKLVHPPAAGHQMEAHIFPLDDDRIIATLPSSADSSANYMSAAQLDAVAIDNRTKMVMLGGYMEYTGKYPAFLDAILTKVVAVSDDPAQRPTIVLTAAAQPVAERENLRQALARVSRVAPLIVAANTGEFRRLLDMDTAWRKPHEAKWWRHPQKGILVASPEKPGDPNTPEGVRDLRASGWTKWEGEDLEKIKQADAAYMADKLMANDAAYRAAYELYCADKALPVTFVLTNGKHGVYVIDGKGISENYPAPKPPHGIVNTVGGGDGYAAGYLLGHVRGLSQRDCVNLGFVCAGEIIGHDEARLIPFEATYDLGDHPVALSGLPAYLDAANDIHKGLLSRLIASTHPTVYENERRFLVAGDGWRAAVRDVFAIRQNYLPAVADGGLRIYLDGAIDAAIMTARNAQGDILRISPISEAAMKKFGRGNLPLITGKDGLVPTGDKIVARIRLKRDQYFVTIKGRTDIPGQCPELEFPLAAEDAQLLLPYCADGVTKTRHETLFGGRTWEVDIFDGLNAGLIVAEIELPKIDEAFSRPAWLGREITGEGQYANASLARKPYTSWPQAGL